MGPDTLEFRVTGDKRIRGICTDWPLNGDCALPCTAHVTIPEREGERDCGCQQCEIGEANARDRRAAIAQRH